MKVAFSQYDLQIKLYMFCTAAKNTFSVKKIQREQRMRFPSNSSYQ